MAVALAVFGCLGPSFDLQVFSTLEENHEEHVAPRVLGGSRGANNKVFLCRMSVVYI